ncbi:glutamine--fructose-6-phosphate transaminase (isomerizing) [Candidatus Uhrbacteria bacterium]|nr:glutamine--fructose-6-phosphate transaminase (isomerizing) [Candidatus Uhrbacteria bacterium]
MCGIVGYIGQKQAAPILLEGLKRLEYRGYDSAGVALSQGGMIEVVKEKGRISLLEEKMRGQDFAATLGISHTRWATHGEPSEKNAHPHYDCNRRIAVAHNGIIENFIHLRRKLEAEGHKFISETDTEVLSHLIEKFYIENLSEAVRQALKLVRGTYGIAVLAADQPNVIVAARRGSPLVVGLGEGEYFLSSDVSALLPFTRKVIYPDDGEMIRLSREGYSTLTLDNEPVQKDVHTVTWNVADAEKGEYPHFMLKEIFEQPQVVRAAITGRLLPEEGTARLDGLNILDEELRGVNRVIFIACGTAAYAGMVGAMMIEELAGIRSECLIASEFRYRRAILSPDTLVFVISQSGETADTIAAMREVRRKGNEVLGIINVVGSTIARETDGGLFIHAGPEIGVASTKAFMGQLTTLALIALRIARLRDMPAASGRRLAVSLMRVPPLIESILFKRQHINNFVAKYGDFRNFLYLGRKFSYPIALEGALKLKEISYIHAEAYAAGEMKHGPIALVDPEFPAIAIAPKDSVYEKTVSNLEEIRARRGKVLAIATEGDEEIAKHVDDVFYIPAIEEVLEPLLAVVPLQLFAYGVAVKKGLDVDKPRNLAKSVTVE